MCWSSIFHVLFDPFVCPWYLNLIVAQNTVRKYEVNRVFWFVEGILLHPRDRQIWVFFFGKDPFYFICAQHVLSCHLKFHLKYYDLSLVELGDKLAGALDQCGLFEPDTRSIDVILKEAKGRNGLGVDCQDITNHLGITDDGNICESVVSCISNFNGYPSCEEVQGCFGGLPFTRQNLAMPTCQEIDTVLQYIEDYINNAVLNTRSLAKNRDDSCPSFQDIVNYLEDEYAGSLGPFCLFL